MAERRHLLELLDVRGTVYRDQDGPQTVRLGRIHRHRIDWQARPRRKRWRSSAS
jgi:hypothetical protein